MRGRKTTSIPDDIEEFCQRLEEWRRAQTGRARIPENMWGEAVELARRHGVHQTARTLRLDYVKVKKRLEMGNQTERAGGAGGEIRGTVGVRG
jgi:hypothetical protein